MEVIDAVTVKTFKFFGHFFNRQYLCGIFIKIREIS